MFNANSVLFWLIWSNCDLQIGCVSKHTLQPFPYVFYRFGCEAIQFVFKLIIEINSTIVHVSF